MWICFQQVDVTMPIRFMVLLVDSIASVFPLLIDVKVWIDDRAILGSWLMTDVEMIATTKAETEAEAGVSI
jgi:hypothetical protein